MKILSISLLFLLFIAASCAQKSTTNSGNDDQPRAVVSVDIPDPIEKIHKSDEEWRAELSDNEYYVLREAGTERPGTSPLLRVKDDGVFVCGACALPLFGSDAKFESGTGWPSFFQPLEERVVSEERDNKFGMTRVEINCARCDSHLGHVFNDGPKPTGHRYCINGVALDFEKIEVEEIIEE